MRTSPRIFQQEFAGKLQKHDIVRSKADPQVFFGKDGSLYAVHYDLIYTGSNLEKMRTIISSEFKAKHAGEIGNKWQKFLGRWYRWATDHFEVMIPTAYMTGIIEDLGLENCKPVATPSVMQAVSTTTTSPFLNEAAHARYRRVVGKLIWTLQERPDLTQAVTSCARAVQTPTEMDMIRLKRIGRYLAGTLEYKLSFILSDDPADRVDVITDASWARRPDRKSISEVLLIHIGFLFGAWSRVQKVVSHSSCEAEITAAHQGISEGKLLMHLLKEQQEIQGIAVELKIF